MGNQIAKSRLASLPSHAQAPSRDPACLLPATIYLDDTDDPGDVIDALILAAFVDGRQPYARTARMQQVRPGAALTPADARTLRVAADAARKVWLAAGEGWTLHAALWRAGGADLTVTATDEELADSVIDKIIADAAAEPVVDDENVTIGFWHHSKRRGPYRSVRPVMAEPWSDIRRNYASTTAAALDHLMAMTPELLTGQLLLLYGPPGTGKTTALRALAREWLPWCATDCVLDPEALFSDPGYLMEVALGEDDIVGDAARRWRLLLLEDCDELIGGEAKRASGQALSRLLNLTDGLLGQGRRVLVALTTNEDLRSLHPAVIRPGRCLAQIEVGPLPPTEATAWLGRDCDVGSPVTLADLYARRNSRAPISSVGESSPLGLYL